MGKSASRAQGIMKHAVPHRNQYMATIILASVQAVIALVCTSLNRIPVFGSIHRDLKTVLFTIGFLILNMLIIDPIEWSYSSAQLKRRILDYIPHETWERLIWIPVSLVVSISEEIVYRAAFFGLLFYLFGNYWLAGTIAAIIFAVAHRKYGLPSMVSIFFVGLGLQYIVYVSGGLYLPIAIHFIHNFGNGVIYGMRERESVKAHSPIG
jgi:membrane protease YdiL (CAAX protease family)